MERTVQNKITQAVILAFIKPFVDRNNRKIRKTSGNNPSVKYGEFKNSLCGVLWGKDKEVGNLYHAYCYGDLIFKHRYKEGFFEDATTYKKDCEAYARKKGWIIGTGIYKDIPICPTCIEKIKCRLEAKKLKAKERYIEIV